MGSRKLDRSSTSASGSDEFLKYGGANGAPVTSTGFACAMWYRPDALLDTATLFSMGDQSVTGEYWAVTCKASGKLSLVRETGGNSHDWNTAQTLSLDIWHLVTYNAIANGDHTLFVDSEGTQNTDSSLWPTGIDNVVVGAKANSANWDAGRGRAAWFTVWSNTLNNQEIDFLVAAGNPFNIQPENIVMICPLWGEHDPEIDLSSGQRSMTNTNTLVRNGPPVGLWIPGFSQPLAAGSGGFTGSVADVPNALALLGVGL